MRLVLISIGLMIALSACAPVQDSYKPLYQATPEKQAVEAS